MKQVNHEVRLEQITPNAAALVELAGRTCYKSECAAGKDPAGFIRRIIASGHHSVLEHAVATVRIITDRGITHELVRHRIASFSQESTRFCNYAGGRFGGELQFIRPVEMREDCWDLWLEACSTAERIYLEMLARGEKPQNARSVLPTCLKTEIVMTANLREWRHFFHLRKAPDAHPDMRVVAGDTFRLILDRAPEFFPEVGE